MIPLIGLIIGLIIGLLLNVPIPQAYGMYIAILVISALTSLTGTIEILWKTTIIINW